MSETASTESPFARRLRLIHERMTGVSEEEVEVALLMARAESTDRTMGASRVATNTLTPERGRWSEFALTRTA